MKIQVSSEIGRLRSLIIHSPDSGIGRVVPSKAQDWLFEDILHLETVRKGEYDLYIKLLLYFLDPDKIKGRLSTIDAPENNRSFYKPSNSGFHHSEKIIEIEKLLADILAEKEICRQLTASVCAIEGCSYKLQQELLQIQASELAKIFISGAMLDENMVFPPIPNFIFTRDIGITINDHILLNKPAKKARSRETLLARYIFFNHPYFYAYRNKILEIPDRVKYFLRPGEGTSEKTTLEGGDVMVVNPDHVIIGVSERTTASGASETIKLLFERDVIQKVTVIRVPQRRDYMHIDTVFTQVKRDTWVLLGAISSLEKDKKEEAADFFSSKRNNDKPTILQFKKDDFSNPVRFDCIEDLLDDISRNELKSGTETKFIYSGNQEFPYDMREQWTDSCNLLALKEGVVLGYDRNDKTISAFKDHGFNVIKASELIYQLENARIDVSELANTLVLMPSGELSRARGGFHCMSMPLLRDPLDSTFI